MRKLGRIKSLKITYLYSVGLIVCAAVFLITTIDAFTIYDQVSARLHTEQTTQVNLAKARISLNVERIKQTASDFFRSAEVSLEHSPGNISHELHRLMKIMPEIEEVALISRYVQLRYSAARIGLDQDALVPYTSDQLVMWKSEQDWALGPITDIDGHSPHIVLCYCASNAAYLGLIKVNLKFLADAVMPIINSGEKAIFIVSKSGKVLAHTNYSQILKRPSFFYDTLQNTVRNHNIADDISIHRAGGVVFSDAYLASTTIAPLDWRIFSEIPAYTIYKPVWSVVIRGIFSSLVMLILLYPIVSLLATRMVLPIRLIEASSLKIANGDMTIRLVEAGDQEIISVTKSLNNMAAQLQDYTQNLEQKVADKTLQLELANKHKSEFLANMSHELRTPLNAVIGFSDALREEYFGALNAKQREYVNDIASSGQLLLSLINDILDLSKIESGMMDLSLTNFSVTSAIDNAMVLIRERAIRQEVTVTSEIGEGVNLLYADERKFKQVLINLLTNAVKFTYPNGWVKISAVIEGANLKVSVADSGLGIAAEDFETVFQEFRQLTSVGEAKHEGTGLGLPLAKRIVELHDGRIWLESELGKGATFLFVIPLDVASDENLMKVQ